MRLFLAILSLNLAICLAICAPATAQPSQPVSEFDITAEQSAVCSAGKSGALDFYRALVDGWEADGRLIAANKLYPMVRRVGPRLLIAGDQAWGVDLRDNTDVCAALNWDISGRQYRIRTYFPISGILAVGRYAKETNGLYLFRLHDGAKAEIDGGQKLRESPDGHWLAIVEWDMGVEPAVSLWNTSDPDLSPRKRLSDATDAAFHGPARLVISYRDCPPVTLHLRDGAWVEDSIPP